MEAKTFSVKRDGKPGVHVIGFPADGHRPFVNVKIGDNATSGEFCLILHMDEVRALAAALASAIDHAEPRAVDALSVAAE